MAQQQKMQMPGVFGGLMRYDDEFKGKFVMSPAVVMAFVVAIIVFVLILKVFFPIGVLGGGSVVSGGGGVPIGHGGFILSLLSNFI